MKQRQERHAAIREIVSEGFVKTQRDLAVALKQRGFQCTQATVSRDISEIGLVKSAKGTYVLPEELRLQRMAAELVESVSAAGNLVVVRTYPGGATSVSAALDAALKSSVLKGLLGTVAGDNTIFIAVDTPERALAMVQSLERLRGV